MLPVTAGLFVQGDQKSDPLMVVVAVSGKAPRGLINVEWHRAPGWCSGCTKVTETAIMRK